MQKTIEKISKINYNVFKKVRTTLKKRIELFRREEINTPWHYLFSHHKPVEDINLVMPFHWHDYFEFEIVFEGETLHILNDKKYIIKKGSAYLLTPFDFHAMEHINGQYFPYIYNFIFSEEALPKEYLSLLPLINSANCQFDEQETQIVFKEIEFLDGVSKMVDSPLKTELMKCSFVKVITMFLQRCGIGQNNTENTATLETFHKAVALVKYHFREEIELNFLAKKVGFSPNYLGQLFKKEFGVSYNEFLKNIRLKYAKNLLKHSDYSVAEIAKNSGFKTTSYFIQCFKEKYNITPKQYIFNLNK